MKETGVKVVRVAELHGADWSHVKGIISLTGWIERFDLFHKYGLQVVIGTPTATPPRWLTTKFPDVLPIFEDGTVFHPGVRGHRCYNSLSLREYSGRITQVLGQHYSAHPVNGANEV